MRKILCLVLAFCMICPINVVAEGFECYICGREIGSLCYIDDNYNMWCLDCVNKYNSDEDYDFEEDYYYEEDYGFGEYENNEKYDVMCPYCEEEFMEYEILYKDGMWGMCPYCEEFLEGYEKDKLTVYIWYEKGDVEGFEEYIVHIEASDPNAEIYYTVNGDYPSKHSDKYEEPVSVIGKKPVVRAIAYLGKESSDVVNVWLKPSGVYDPYEEEYEIEDDWWYEENETEMWWEAETDIDKGFGPNEMDESESYVLNENVKIELTIGSSVIYINGAAVTIDAPPVIRNERTMVPIRVIAEALGATVTWMDGASADMFAFYAAGENNSGQIVSIETQGGGHDYWITIGATQVTVWNNFMASDFNPNIDTHPVLDSPAFIENDRTYLPVRFVSEALGATVKWDNATQKVTITK